MGFLFIVLDPTKITALGVTVESSERRWLLFLLLMAIVYFEFAFFTASRADYHVWKRGLSEQRNHLVVLEDEAASNRAHEQLDQNLADGENPAEIERRRAEVEAGRERQRATRDHLKPVVRSFAVRGWVDFWLAPLYGVAVSCALVFELARAFK